MFIEKISLTDFRNYINEETVFGRNINMITGENAQGKTNLLESIYFTSFGKSFRTSKNKDLIRFERDFCRVSADYVREEFGNEKEKVEIAFSKEGKKAAKINGRKVEKISELISNYYVVVFSPEDLRIVKDEPEKRRNFIDRELCQLSFSYYDALTKYKRTLLQRNKYLKEKNIDIALLDIWDENLASEGSKIIIKRKEFVDSLSEISNKIHKSITNGRETSMIEYLPSVRNEKNQKEFFIDILKERRQRDIEHGNTLSGPHKDDIDIKIEGKSTRRYGSQGQQRTVALSMKLAEIELIREEKKEYPILLLDDVFSELDEERQHYLVDYLKKMQVFITSAEIPEKLIKLFPESKKTEIKKGKIINY